MFDDRLETVLRTRAQSTAGERTQFRQLLDLLGTAPPQGTDSPTYTRAYARLDDLRSRIPGEEQSRILRETGLRLRSPQLVAYLADAEPRAAASAMATARLSEEEWEALIPTLPVIARGFLRHRRDLPPGAVRMLARLGVGDLALPDPRPMERVQPAPATRTLRPFPPRAPVQPQLQQPPAPRAPKPEPEPIGALLERIEQFREGRRAPVLAPHLPLGDMVLAEGPAQIRQFDAMTDATGRAISASDPVAPWISGMLLTAHAPGALVRFDGQVATALRQHQPIRAAAVTIAAAPAISGNWRLDATPAFSPHDGAFAGYHCRLRRPPPAAANAPDPDTRADRMRQVLHELRTPVGAVQGFAEIIQQQIFGPVPHAYRAHAAAIAVDAANLLAGFEEIDRLARLEDEPGALTHGETDFAMAISQTLRRLEAALRPRQASFAFSAGDGPFTVPFDQGEALALCWRVLATIAGALGPGETAPLELTQSDGVVRLSCTLPEPLRGEAIHRAILPEQRGAINAGMFGPGFAFRLARAEIEAAGGEMQTTAESLAFTLPVLTGEAGAHSTSEGSSRS